MTGTGSLAVKITSVIRLRASAAAWALRSVAA